MFDNQAVMADIYATMSRVRDSLDLVWRLWRVPGGGGPPVDTGQPLSDRACVHAAFILADELGICHPEFTWRVQGGWAVVEDAGSPESAMVDDPSHGGFRRGEHDWVHHMWVVGQQPATGATLLADITADQFVGMPKVFLHPQVHHDSYRGNMPRGEIIRLATSEGEFVELMRPIMVESRRLCAE
jgi:hypothetical protein